MVTSSPRTGGEMLVSTACHLNVTGPRTKARGLNKSNAGPSLASPMTSPAARGVAPDTLSLAYEYVVVFVAL